MFVNFELGLRRNLRVLPKRNSGRSAIQCSYIRHCASFLSVTKPEDHRSCIAHLSDEDILRSEVIEDKKFKNIESE